MSEQTKAAKDLRQAGDLLDVLLEDRPADVQVAWEALAHNASAAKLVRRATGRLAPELRERLPSRTPGSGSGV